MNDTYINRFIPNTNKLIHKNLSTETTMKSKLCSVLCMMLMSLPIICYSQERIVGQTDCGTWIKINRPADRGWILGYLSGINTDKNNQDILRKLDSAEQTILFVDNYCRNNPLEKTSSAAWQLLIELAKK